MLLHIMPHKEFSLQWCRHETFIVKVIVEVFWCMSWDVCRLPFIAEGIFRTCRMWPCWLLKLQFDTVRKYKLHILRFLQKLEKRDIFNYVRIYVDIFRTKRRVMNVFWSLDANETTLEFQKHRWTNPTENWKK